MINDIKNAIQKATKSFGMTKANVNNKKKDSINSNNVIKNLSTSPDAKPWYKKKASIIAMSSALGVGVLAIAIAVPVALTSQKSNDTNTLPPITVTEILSPIQLLSISFNEAEIRKNNINNITIEILKANIIVPTAMVPLELTISGLVKNVDLNFCTFHLGTVSEVYIVKTIYWDVTYSNVQPNLLYDKFLNAWNKHTGPTSKWNILYDVFVGKNKLYQEAFYCDSLLYSLTNDLLLNNEVYNYFKDKK